MEINNKIGDNKENTNSNNKNNKNNKSNGNNKNNNSISINNKNIFENSILNAYLESYRKTRKGDKKEEVDLIKEYILNAKNIVIATNNLKKFQILKDLLLENVYKDNNRSEIKIFKINIPTEVSDLTRMPVLSKGLMALDTSNADIVIARGRLGIPGSGSMLLIMDNKGRILTGYISPPSVMHKKNIEDSVRDELIGALKRIGVI
ncbi:DUF3236 family protein [Methanothermococcus sp. SCGC AD-155-C09]|nr:DUF3236 family protein [Methanothermococcus sp. SCGC AD-155-C09]